MSQKLPANNLEGIEDTSQFNEEFRKYYNEESNKGYFIEYDVQYPEKLHELHNSLSFSSERMQVENVENVVSNLHD